MVNQLTGRNTDATGGDEFTLAYDGVGNLTDDGQNYEYVYDVWGRLRQVKDTGDQHLIAEYWYNGLGYRITMHEDTEPDGDVDANDPKYHLIYDERWRLIAVYRADDDNPKELFVYHQAGLDGAGGSSYIDSVILRQRDANSGWTSAADSTMEERRYYCQNWRADVSAIITSGGLIVEWAKYSAYGIPFGLPGGDTDSDGDCDATDITQIQTWIDAPAYDVRGDVDLDGDVDSTDKTLAINNYQGATSGWNALSASAVANRVGYAGYQHDYNLDLNHVRNRVYSAELGRWTRRDPLGYVDGMGLYDYCQSMAIVQRDARGLATARCNAAVSPQSNPPTLEPQGTPTRRESQWPSFLMDGNNCLGLYDSCLRNFQFQYALSYAESACKGSTNCSSWVVMCEDVPGGRASVNCANCTISMGGGEMTCEMLAHELIHAGDNCSYGHCGCHIGNFMDKWGRLDCDAWMCTEIRASFYGCCVTNPGNPWDCFSEMMEFYMNEPICGRRVNWEKLLDCCTPASCGGGMIGPYVPFNPHCNNSQH